MARSEHRIYVGNLPPDIRTKDIQDLFYKFGKISFVDLKTRRGPPFAFVEFVDPRDAKDAVNSRDGYDYDGYKIRVEFPRGRERGPGGVFKSSPRRSAPPSRRSNYRICVTGLPPSGSWQDLKDHMREAGDVCYANVFKDGTGVVEFVRYEDMKYAIKKLDDTKFRSHEGEIAYVRVKEDTERNISRSRSRSRSRSTSLKRYRGSPTYSPARDGHKKRISRSRSSSEHSRSRSMSKSRSRSRSPKNRNGRIHSRSYSRSDSHSSNSNRSELSKSQDKYKRTHHSRSRSMDRHSSSRSRSRSRSK